MAVKEKAKESLIAEDKTKESSSFKKWKELAATGLLSASLLLSPIPGKAIIINDAADPPTKYSSVLEKKYPEGWRYILKANELLKKGKKSEGNADKAIKYFEKLEGAESFYLLAYATYQKAIEQTKYEKAEDYFNKTVDICDKGIERYDKIVFIALKMTVIYNLGFMYAEAYRENGDETYKQKGIEFLNNFLKLYAQFNDRFGEDGQKQNAQDVRTANSILEKLQK